MARRPAQVPLDDEPLDIDLSDLPSEAEFAEAELAEAEGYDEDAEAESAPAERSILGVFQLWVTLVALLYVGFGLGVGALFAFRGAAGVGLAALGHPKFYLIVLFWPIALWQLLLGQL